MSPTWHADDTVIMQYLRGEAGVLPSAGLEQHLTACADCRARMADQMDIAPLDVIWARIQEEAQAPTPSLLQRLLTRVGVTETDALLVSAAPSLRTSWLLGLAVTLGFVGLAAAYGGTRGMAGFLLVAPLVPMAGVAFAYGSDVDPAYEVSVAAPYSAARLLLLRTAAVLATSLPLTLAAGLLVPALSWTTVWWLLPALALTALVLAASTWVLPTVAAVGLGTGWFCAVGAAAIGHHPGAVLAPGPLLAYAAVGLAAVFVVHLRIDHLTPQRNLP
jgi:hypothetical protein